MNLTVKSIPGFRPFAIGIPKIGTYYLLSDGVPVRSDGHAWHEVLVWSDPEERGGVGVTVPVYDVPEGYRPVRFGPVKAGEFTADSKGEVFHWQYPDELVSFLVVEPVDTVKVKAPIGFKPVAIRVPNQGDLIYSDGTVRSAWPGGCPRLIVERHQAEPENPPVLGEVGFFNDELELAELTGYDSHLKLYQNAFGSSYKFRLGLDAGEVELEVEVPDGYRAVRWGNPEKGDYYVEEADCIRKGSWFAERLIVEPLEPQWKEPTLAEGQPARFWDNGWSIKSDGYLYGTGYVHKRGKVFIDESNLLWDKCEVKA